MLRSQQITSALAYRGPILFDYPGVDYPRNGLLPVPLTACSAFRLQYGPVSAGACICRIFLTGACNAFSGSLFPFCCALHCFQQAPSGLPCCLWCSPFPRFFWALPILPDRGGGVVWGWTGVGNGVFGKT